MKKLPGGFFAFGLVLLATLVALRLAGGSSGVAPTPAMFDSALTFESALAQSGDTGKPVFAFVTADWCGPCQAFKRGALTDEAVTAFVTERTIPVYIDSDEHPDVADQLGVQGIPMVALLRDGAVVSRQTGVVSAEALMQWLNEGMAR